jgi:hypothetical protein
MAKPFGKPLCTLARLEKREDLREQFIGDFAASKVNGS